MGRETKNWPVLLAPFGLLAQSISAQSLKALKPSSPRVYDCSRRFFFAQPPPLLFVPAPTPRAPSGRAPSSSSLRPSLPGRRPAPSLTSLPRLLPPSVLAGAQQAEDGAGAQQGTEQVQRSKKRSPSFPGMTTPPCSLFPA